MNMWKTSTIALAAAITLLAGRDALKQANAATSGAQGANPVAYDWGLEQPHMERALNDLRAARHSLEAAAEHKGGWRVLALRHTDDAIAETIRGIEWAKAHPRE